MRIAMGRGVRGGGQEIPWGRAGHDPVASPFDTGISCQSMLGASRCNMLGASGDAEKGG